MGKYYHKKYTISDTAAPLTPEPLIFIDLDFQCQTESVNKGDKNSQDLLLLDGDVQSFRDESKGIDIRPMFFKNAAPGSTGYIVVDGVLKE